MEQLLALEMPQFDIRSASQAGMEKLHEKAPTPILAHHERLVPGGSKGVAIARNGVCSERNLYIGLSGTKLPAVVPAKRRSHKATTHAL